MAQDRERRELLTMHSAKLANTPTYVKPREGCGGWKGDGELEWRGGGEVKKE